MTYPNHGINEGISHHSEPPSLEDGPTQEEFEMIPNNDQVDMFSEHQQPAESVDNNGSNETKETTQPSLRRSNRAQVPTNAF